MTGDSENAAVKKENEEDVASTSRSTHPSLFGSPVFNFLRTDKHIIANSFNPSDVNSADDIRQQVKAVMANKKESKSQNQEPQKTEPDQKPEKSKPDNNKESKKNGGQGEPHCSKPKQHRKRRRSYVKLEIKDSSDSEPDRKAVGKKRRGRPPKAGPSKKRRRLSTSDLYKGRLANYVVFEKHSDSDSDTYLYS